MKSRFAFTAVTVLQILCAAVIIWEIGISVLQLPVPPVNWEIYEVVELGAAIGLALGAVMGMMFVRQSRRETARARSQLRAASGAFMDLLEDRFLDWGLTPAERDVALFAIKGLSLQEIALLRQTSEGTIKAQTASIYRKAGVNGRPQLLSLFIEDLINDELAGRAKAGSDGVNSAA